MYFEPYEMTMELCGMAVPYIVATQQAREWFDPLKPYTKLEYEWVMNNIPLDGEIVVDAGCHQGNYAVVFAACGADVVAVDAHKTNCTITAHNLSLYDTESKVLNAAVWSRGGLVNFTGASNGMVVSSGGVMVQSYTLPWLSEYASVVKVDIEGAEFEILPAAFDEMDHVDWWIIEIHPANGDPEVITSALIEREYELVKVDREQMAVVPYVTGSPWPTHATVIGGKK